MKTDVRTNMYFPRGLYAEMKLKASGNNMSVAELVRESVARYLKLPCDKNVWDNDPVWSIVGSSRGRRKDVSAHHDKYLYRKG